MLECRCVVACVLEGVRDVQQEAGTLGERIPLLPRSDRPLVGPRFVPTNAGVVEFAAPCGSLIGRAGLRPRRRSKPEGASKDDSVHCLLLEGVDQIRFLHGPFGVWGGIRWRLR